MAERNMPSREAKLDAAISRLRNKSRLDRAGRKLLRALSRLSPDEALHSDDIAAAAGIAERVILDLRNYLLGQELIEVATPQRDRPASWYCRLTPKGRMMEGTA